MAVGYQSFYQGQLTANISDTDLTIPLDAAPTPSEGFLVIESTVVNKREIIYYTSKTSNSVTCPANGRGYDGTTARSHLQGASVIMAPVGAMFEELRDQFTTTPQGWTSIVPAVSTVTANGNRSYTVAFASDVSGTLSEGMRLRTTRTVASTQNAFSLDGSNDYYNKTSPSGMTFTDDFSVSAWVYLTAYGAISGIASRYNGTSGWSLQVNASGVPQLYGFNANSANYSGVQSYQSIPLNKWVHIAAQLDMSAFTATTTTSYIMIDGVNVPAVVDRSGTNPTALVQAGNLEIGSRNAGTQPFPGYIDQVAIYSAKVTQATILASMNQALTGSETSLISAYSNGSTTDLNTTNANNLTAQNGATTASKSPFGNNATSSTLDYALVMAVSGSTVTVQVPEGCTIPTTGGISAVAYSTQANPYGFVSDKGRWELQSRFKVQTAVTSNANFGSFASGGWGLTVPVGGWEIGYNFLLYSATTTAIHFTLSPTAQTAAAGSETTPDYTTRIQSAAAATSYTRGSVTNFENVSAQSTYTIYTAGATTSGGVVATGTPIIKAIPTGL